MDLKQLEYFVCVAEAGSFTRAAAILRVAQPAVSRKVRQLEEELHTRLLTRNGRGAVTTEAGERFLVQSRGILRQVARAQEEIHHLSGATTGKATIGMPYTVCAYLGVPLVREFRERLPNVELTLVQGRSTALQEWLASGRIDLAVLYDVPFSPSVEKVTLATDNLVLVQPPEAELTTPIVLEQIHKIPLIIPSQPNTIRMLIETHLARHGHKPRIELEIDNVSNILELVRSGFGNAVLSRRAVKGWPGGADLPLRKIIEPELHVSLHLAIPSRPPTAAQNAAVELIDQLCHAVFA